DVALEIVGRPVRVRVGALSDCRGDAFLAGPHHLHVADRADGRAVASPHAGSAHDANVGPEPVRESAQEMLGSGHRAGERIANPHCGGGRRRLVFFHHVEMRVESRNFVDLSERKLHLLRERGEVRGGEIAVAILNEVQMLDQQIAPALAIAQYRAHLGKRLRLDLTAFWSFARMVAPSQSSAIVGSRVHCNQANQNSPTMRPSGPTSIESAAGTLGRPGMVMISPQIATTNSAPADRRTSRTVTT